MEIQSVYYGETKCCRDACKNKAYYVCDASNVCGVHSRNKTRTDLPKRPKDEVEQMRALRLTDERTLIEQARAANVSAGKKGSVMLSRLLMMREPENTPGFLKVFPNFKHQGRKDGFGCMKLSPMSLGPVMHGQPGLPPAQNIENFHQGSKCFKEEVGSDGNPSQVYHTNRLSFYNDAIPHRHKFKGDGKNKNIPLYFVWIDKAGKEHHLDYIASRQFYCNFYERLAMIQPDYATLVNWINAGYNLQICGYDASVIENVETAYLDATKPFGHEKVLYSMLRGEAPWRAYKTFDF